MENCSISAVGYFMSSEYVFKERDYVERICVLPTASRFTTDIRNTSPAQPVTLTFSLIPCS